MNAKTLSLILGATLVGCGGGDTSTTDTDASVSDAARDAARVPDAAPVIEDSFDAPIMVTSGTTQNQAIETQTDTDTFAIDLSSPGWLRFVTFANPDDDESKINTVIEVFNSDRQKIAVADSTLGVDGWDTEAVVQVTAAGRYYAVVHDYGEWANTVARGNPAFTYQLDTTFITASRRGFTVDSETGNDLASAQALEFPTRGVHLMAGDFASASDVDVYSFSTTSDGKAMNVYFATPGLDGNEGNGSTATAARAWITSADGTTVFGAVDDLSLINEMMVPLAMGNYLIWVSAPATLGAHPFYVFGDLVRNENPAEPAGEANQSFETATAIEWGTNGYAFVLAQLPDGDVDYFATQSLTAGKRISAVCVAQASGSGVRGLTLELVSSDDTVLATTTEMVSTTRLGASIPATAVSADGVYSIRISKTGQDENNASQWVRCGFRVSDPA